MDLKNFSKSYDREVIYWSLAEKNEKLMEIRKASHQTLQHSKNTKHNRRHNILKKIGEQSKTHELFIKNLAHHLNLQVQPNRAAGNLTQKTNFLKISIKQMKRERRFPQPTTLKNKNYTFGFIPAQKASDNQQKCMTD